MWKAIKEIALEPYSHHKKQQATLKRMTEPTQKNNKTNTVKFKNPFQKLYNNTTTTSLTQQY